MNEGKAVFEELLNEIECADGEMFKPPQKMCQHDKKIGSVEDTFLRKVFALCAIYSREADQLKVKMKYEPDNTELKTEWSKTDAKFDALRELLWYGIRTKYNLWKYESIGVRADWQIVEDTHDEDDNGPPEFLKKLFGM
jgi:hypothetical protein